MKDDKFQRTIDAGRKEISSLQYDGWRVEQVHDEPNKVKTYTLFHPRRYTRLFVTVEPLWGLVVIKNGRSTAKLIRID